MRKKNIVLVDFGIYTTQNNFNHCNSLISKDEIFLINTVTAVLRCSSQCYSILLHSSLHNDEPLKQNQEP